MGARCVCDVGVWWWWWGGVTLSRAAGGRLTDYHLRVRSVSASAGIAYPLAIERTNPFSHRIASQTVD